jgi:hypothetical protein
MSQEPNSPTKKPNSSGDNISSPAIIIFFWEKIMFDNWKWLIGTYWYVPSSTLLAPLFSSDQAQPQWLSDQTVWQITGYENGYFWGNVAARMLPVGTTSTQQAPSAQRVMASVTPGGKLQMTFAPVDTSNGAAAIVGVGEMRWDQGMWLTEMQMSAPSANNAFILHWSYMLQCKPGDPAWGKLPGTEESLPEFLSAAGFTVDA